MWMRSGGVFVWLERGGRKGVACKKGRGTPIVSFR